MSTMLVLFYLFCDGKTEDNLSQMFNMFDMDGNKVSMKLSYDKQARKPQSYASSKLRQTHSLTGWSVELLA